MAPQQDTPEELEPRQDQAAEMTETTQDANFSDEQDALQEELLQVRSELEEAKNKYLYLYSDMESMRRNHAKERVEMMATAGREIVTALLPIIDDFDRAAKANGGALGEGIELIRQKLENTLSQKGLARMDLKAGDPFDADSQEAVAEVPSPDPTKKGTIVEVLEQGFTLGGKIIRFAKVVVFNA